MSEPLPLESVSKTRRLRILTTNEINDLYARPEFTEDERMCFFELNSNEQKILDANMSNAAIVDVIIRLGYFKQKHQFFNFKLTEVYEDVKHILNRYFPRSTLDKNSIGRLAKLNNQQWVLRMTGHQLFRKQHSSILNKKAENLCRISVNPVFIFRELLAEVTQKKITRPGYSTFQKIIACALVSEQERISQIFKDNLSEPEKTQLLNLIGHKESFYDITLLKQQPKNFKPTAIHQEVEYYEQYQQLYQVVKRLLSVLKISKNGVAYYASLVEHYTVQALNRTNANQTCLWLICFVYYRCQRMLDNLATMLIYTANQYRDEVKKQAEALLLIHSLSPDEQKKALAKLIRVYTDKTFNERQTFKAVKRYVYSTILPLERIEQVANELDNQEQQKLYQTQFTWQAVDEFANTYRPLLRALSKALVFDGLQHKAVQKAYNFLRDILKRNKPLSKVSFDKFPVQFIRRNVSSFIYDDINKTIDTDRYEYECYQQIACYLNGRSLFLNDSINYQSLAAELLPEWEKTKRKVLRKVNNPFLNQSFNQFIEEKAKPLDEKIISVNEAILSGENSYVKLKTKKDGSTIWTLPYTKKSLDLNNPFYEKLPSVSISQIMQFANEQTQFMQQFTHIKPHYAKSQLDEMAIYASLIANGTNLGIFKMASLCDLNLPSLQLTEKNYLRLSTLRSANDIISNAISKLPIFRCWDLQANLLHASLDGQKFVTEKDNLIARYSQKYFGYEKGVVAYSLISNHVPINTMIIGANDHESRFSFDLIYDTTSEIQPDIFSTDTEGSNKLNFLLLHLIGRLFAPRYRSLGDKTESIICFSDPSKFKGCMIKPHKKVNEKLILSEEDNLKHIFASLLMGETKQSNIITKLSSQQFASRTKQALWEMNAILMSDHLLNYICDVTFRQSIQGSLCRVEAYHQLRRHIEKVNGRHFRGSNETQIVIWNECARLLANCLLYYNSLMLNRWMEQSERRGETKKIEFIRNLSPVAWTHANFHGRYEFLSTHEEINIDAWLDKILVTEKDFQK